MARPEGQKSQEEKKRTHTSPTQKSELEHKIRALGKGRTYRDMVKEKSNLKLVFFWLLGSLFLLSGMWIVCNLELALGVTWGSYILAILISLIFFLLTGLCWISVAVATRAEVAQK